MIIPARIHIPPGIDIPPPTPIPPSPEFPHPPITTIPQPPLRQLRYTARGVQFPGLNSQNNPVYLSCSSLACINSRYFSFSFWAQNFTLGSNVGAVIFVANPSGDARSNPYTPFFGTVGNFAVPVLQMNQQMGATLNQTGYWDTLWVVPFSNTDSQWHHYLGSFDSVGKAGVLYIDDVLENPNVSGSIFSPPAQTDNGLPSFICPTSGQPFYVGGDGTNLGGATMNLSDMWIAPGITLLDTDANNRPLSSIRSDVRRIFTDVLSGSVNPIPKDPGAWPTAPIIFTGPAATFGANFGFGGTFSLVGGSLSDVLGP